MATAACNKSARATELDDLAGEQAAELRREERTAKLPRHRGEVRMSELPEAEQEQAEAGGVLRRVARPRQWSVYLSGRAPAQWDAANQPDEALAHRLGDGRLAHLADHFKSRWVPIRCPVCLERELPLGWYCLACNRAGLDRLDEDPAHRFSYPGVDIDQAPDPSYPSAEVKRGREAG